MNIGATPSCESCAQLGSEGYEVRALAECRAYKNQLLRVIRAAGCKVPDTFLRISKNEHDFGTYYEVAINDPEERFSAAAIWAEAGCEEWDDEARAELNLK